jgi:hypothetical protein
MAYDKEIRFRCRALFEVLNLNLTKISEQESVPVATLSDWKNDDREEYGGIWLQGSKAANVEKAAKKLREELRATSVYDEMKNNLGNYYGVTKGGSLEVDGILDLGSDNAQLQAQVETDITMLACIQADYFDAQMFKNSMLSSIVLNNQVKKDVTKVRQADIKASSEIHKMAKEARFGKSPDTVIVNANGNYTVEELNSMSLEQLEQLMKQEQQKAFIGEVVEA